MLDSDREEPQEGEVELPSDPTMTLRPRPARSAAADPRSRQRPDGEGRGGFQLLRLIGRGGHGEVWEARQEALGRLVAVKRLFGDSEGNYGSHSQTSDHVPDPHYLEQIFRQEALITAHLEHPNIVPVHDLGIDESGQPLLAMKLVRGRIWDEMLEEDFRRFDPGTLLARHLPILVDVAQAVAFAHSRGVVHRDLKPSQVMVGEFGESLLMDWGLAVAFDPGALARGGDIPGRKRRRSRSGERLDPSHPLTIVPSLEEASNPAGTPAYMAPEQTDSSALRVGPWTDVYLLGGVLYYLLTGDPPHGTGNSRRAFDRARIGAVEPPEQRAGGRRIPPELSRLAMQALSPDPEDRPAGGARYFVNEVLNYLSGATHQRESERLVRLVEKRLAAARGDYESLTRLSGLLDNARALWESNPELPPLRERVIEETVQAAIAHGDLRLGQVHAARLEPGPIRRMLQAHMDAVEAATRRRERQRQAATRAVGALMVLLAVMAALDFRTRHLEARERLELAFERAAISRVRALNRTVNRALDAAHATAGLFAASDHVDRDSFAAFARQLLARQEEVRILEWIPRVAMSNRIDFELGVRASGLPEFTIFETDGEQTTAPASLRPNYFPVLYAESNDGPTGADVLGYDMASSRLRWEAMEQARDTGRVTATGRLRLVQDHSRDTGWGFLVFVPVYRNGSFPETVAQRREALVGFTAAGLRPVDLLEIAGGLAERAPLAVDLYDETAPWPDRRLVLGGTGLLDQEGEPRGAIKHTAMLDVAGRKWHFVATPTPEFLNDAHLPRRPWALFAGAIVVLALAGYILNDRRESQRIAEAVGRMKSHGSGQ